MFSEQQQKKIQEFATVTKLTNICFSNCINNLEVNTAQNKNNVSNLLSYTENECLRNCSLSYLELNHNVKKQLKLDRKNMVEKNKYILEEKT